MIRQHAYRYRQGWTLVEILTAATVASLLMVFVVKLSLRIQQTYQTMNIAMQARRDEWHLEWDLRRDAMRNEGDLRIITETHGEVPRPAALEWLSGNHSIVRYRHDLAQNRVVREEERAGKLLRRDAYRLHRGVTLDWSIDTVADSPCLMLRTSVTANRPASRQATPTVIIVKLGDSSRSSPEVSP